MEPVSSPCESAQQIDVEQNSRQCLPSALDAEGWRSTAVSTADLPKVDISQAHAAGLHGQAVLSYERKHQLVLDLWLGRGCLFIYYVVLCRCIL